MTCRLIVVLWLLGLNACSGASQYRGFQAESVVSYVHSLTNDEQHCPEPLHILSEQNGHKESMIAYLECTGESIRVITITPLGITHARILIHSNSSLSSELGEPFSGFSADDIFYLLFLATQPSSEDLPQEVTLLKSPCGFRITRDGQHVSVFPKPSHPYCK